MKRSTSSTSLNNQSSRSHSVFQIHLEQQRGDVYIKSKLRIVDLAGSEKYSIKKDISSEDKQYKLEELKSINSSLSALGLCISALSEAQNGSIPQQRKQHIPFRNSKLTRVLKDSLDESSNVALIICVSPSSSNYKETLSTLQFADRAKRAILDIRYDSSGMVHSENNPSTQSLTTLQQNILPSSASSQVASSYDLHQNLNTVLKAYEEEKAIRIGLQQYQNQVIEQMQVLKHQNTELQAKVRELSEQRQPSFLVPMKPKMDISKSEDKVGTDEEEVISINIIPTTSTMGKMKHGQFAKGGGQLHPKKKRSKKNQRPPQAYQSTPKSIPQPLHSALSDPNQQKPKKQVRFAEKLDNDSSLNSSMRERIEHNLKYNDDTIFEGISIFQDLNGSGINHHPKKVKEKEKYPFEKARQLMLQDEEEEKLEEEMAKQQTLQQQNIIIQDLEDSGHPDQQQPSIIETREDQSGGGQEFWNLMSGGVGVNQMLGSSNRLRFEDEASIIKQNSSYILGGNEDKYQDFSKEDNFLMEEEVQRSSSIFGREQQKESSPYQEGVQQTLEVQLFDQANQKEVGYDDDALSLSSHGENNPNTQRALQSLDQSHIQCHVQPNICDASEVEDHMIFDVQEDVDFSVDKGVFEDNSMIEDQPQRQLSSNQKQFEIANMSAINPVNEDGQNTLILDSQSIIIENLKEPSLSSFQNRKSEINERQQHYIKVEAAPTDNNNSISLNMSQQQLKSFDESCILNPQQLGFDQDKLANSAKMGPSAFSNSQGLNPHEDILTYSLTNTFVSTLHSLKEELSAIRNNGGGKEHMTASQNLMKALQQQCEDGEYGADPVDEGSQRILEEMQSFYQKLHLEIAELRQVVLQHDDQQHTPASSEKLIIGKIEKTSRLIDRYIMMQTVKHHPVKEFELNEQIVEEERSSQNNSSYADFSLGGGGNVPASNQDGKVSGNNIQQDSHQLDSKKIIMYEQLPSVQLSNQTSPFSTQQYGATLKDPSLNFQYHYLHGSGFSPNKHSRVSSLVSGDQQRQKQTNLHEEQSRQKTPEAFKGLLNSVIQEYSEPKLQGANSFEASFNMEQPQSVIEVKKMDKGKNMFAGSEADLLATLRSFQPNIQQQEKKIQQQKGSSPVQHDNTLTLNFDDSMNESSQAPNVVVASTSMNLDAEAESFVRQLEHSKSKAQLLSLPIKKSPFGKSNMVGQSPMFLKDEDMDGFGEPISAGGINGSGGSNNSSFLANNKSMNLNSFLMQKAPSTTAERLQDENDCQENKPIFSSAFTGFAPQQSLSPQLDLPSFAKQPSELPTLNISTISNDGGCNLTQHQSLQEASGQTPQSTSKTSVHKYWRQYFNPSQNPHSVTNTLINHQHQIQSLNSQAADQEGVFRVEKK